MQSALYYEVLACPCSLVSIPDVLVVAENPTILSAQKIR